MIDTKTRALEAAALRKAFNREHEDIRLGMLLRTPKGEVGVYQGISTFPEPDQITVLLYRVNEGSYVELTELPSKFEYLGRRIPIVYRIKEKPNIEKPKPSWYY